MCRVLSISRSVYYYKSKEKSDDSILASLIKNIFEHSRKSYGTRRIKFELNKEEQKISRRKISHIMNQEGLISKYTLLQFKPHRDKTNESQGVNLVECKFNEQEHLQVVVSDLTYVKVGNR